MEIFKKHGEDLELGTVQVSFDHISAFPSPGAISSERNHASGGGQQKIIFFVNVKIMRNVYFSIRQ